MDEDKPTGTYRCAACERIWDGSDLILDPKSIVPRYTCGDGFCDANVRRISELPKVEYEKSLEDKVD